MFWGLILKANKKYTQTTKQAFHVSQAALDVTSCADGPIQLFLTYEGIKYLICTLRKNTAEQVMLDLNFNEGDEISLQSQGSGTIHISGYITDLSDQFDGLSEEESDAGEEMLAIPPKKSKKQEATKAANNSKSGKKPEAVAVADEDDDDDDEDDSDFNGEEAPPGADSDDDEEEDDDDDDEDGDDDDDDEDEDEDESEDEDEEVQQPKAKQIKLEKPKQNGVEPQQKKDGKQKKDKKEAAPQQEKQQQQAAQKSKGEQTLAGGVKIEDVRVGNGPEAKQGKRAQVYYEGRLKSNNKVFDSLKQGAPFKFGLGRGEVIKGWDVGVVGMKVGGKRRITCPAHMAYGARGSPPTIPPNSTLVFDVELKGVQ